MTNLLTQAEIISMRDEVVNTQLNHLCSISRRSQVGEDPGGQPTYEWADIATLEPCHYWKEVETEIVGPQNAVVARERLVLQALIDISEQDRITSLTDTDGTNIVADTPLDVIEVERAQNQTVCVLKQIS